MYNYFLFGYHSGTTVGQQTWYSQVASLNPGWALLRSGLRQATYTCVPLSLSSTISHWSRNSDALWLGS